MGVPSGIEARNLNGRKLWNDNPRRAPFLTDRVCQIDGLARSKEFERDDLVANPKAHAVREVAELFKRFTWSPGEDFIADVQSELYRRP